MLSIGIDRSRHRDEGNVYDEKGKVKPATTARKHLKKANDLFNTMMRIGITDKKPPLPLAVEQ